MTRDANTQNTAANQNETSAEQQKKAKKQAESTVSRAIRVFVEEQMYGRDGQQFFNRIRKDNGYTEEELRRMLSETVDRHDEFLEQDDHLKEAFANVTARQIRNIAIGVGAGFESQRSTLSRIITDKYDFSAADRTRLEGYIENNLSLPELTDCIRGEARRMKLLKQVFPNLSGRDLEAKRRENTDEIDKVFAGKSLSDEQKAAAARLLNASSISASDLRPILGLFDSLEDKQLLIKLFLPHVSLADLREAGVLTHAQVRDAIRKSITDDHGRLHAWKQDLSDDEVEAIVRTIRPEEIMIETHLFPQEVVDAILGSAGAEYIADEINDAKKEMRTEYAKMANGMELSADAEGKYLPNFRRELRKMGIADADKFAEGSYIQWEVVDADGKTQKFVYRIDILEDDPAKNSKLYDGSPRIAVRQILLADGSWNRTAPKETTMDMGYGKMRDFLSLAMGQDKKTPLRIHDEAAAKQLISNAEIQETIPESIADLEGLNNAINSLDPTGRAHVLKPEGGVCLGIGEPGTADYHVYRISSIDVRNNANTIAVNDGGGGDEILKFDEFVAGFRGYEGKCKRIGTLTEGMSGVLSLLSSTLKSPGGIKELSIDHGKILTQSRKDDHDFPGVTEFVGSKGLIRIDDMSDPKKVTFSHFPKYKEGGEYGKWLQYTVGYHSLYQFLADGQCEPKIPDPSMDGPEKAHAHVHESKGWFKSYLGNYSIHDMMKGLTDTVGFFKHHLHHGASLNAAKFQLALGKRMKWLGVDEGILSEMRSKVHTDARKLMNETVEQLKWMPWPDCQEEVSHILGNKGAHDYELHAAAIAMLQKHGTFYVWKQLIPLRGSFIFFERISKQKYSPNLKIVQETKKKCAENGEPFTEERLLQEYLKERGGKPYYEVDGNLWREFKKAWESGMADEMKKWEEEAYKFVTLQGRTNYVMGKFKDNEFSHGLGWIKAVLDKGGASHEMHLPGVVLALSNIPSYLGKDQIKMVRNMFLGARPYTALSFIDTPSDQQTFRNVIKKLCANNTNMKGAYARVEHLQHHGPENELVAAIMDFWDKYGETLNAKLYITRDAEIFHKKDSDSDFATYFDRCAGKFSGYKKPLEKEELSNGAYDHSHSSFFAFNPEQYMKLVEANSPQGLFMRDEITEMAWESILKSISAIKDMQLSGTDEEVRQTKLALYARYHKTLITYFSKAYNDVQYPLLEAKNHIKQLTREQGIRLPPYGADLSTPSYNNWIKEDFDAFMWGGRNTKSAQIHVLDSMDNVLGADNDNVPMRAAA